MLHVYHWNEMERLYWLNRYVWCWVNLVQDNISCQNPSCLFFQSTVYFCIESCYHIWSGALTINLEIFNTIERKVCNDIGPDMSSWYQSFSHCSIMTSLCPVYKYFLEFKCSIRFEIHHFTVDVTVSSILFLSFLGHLTFRTLSISCFSATWSHQNVQSSFDFLVLLLPFLLTKVF